MNKIALRINVCANDWTVKRAIIASNVTVSSILSAVNLDLYLKQCIMLLFH